MSAPSASPMIRDRDTLGWTFALVGVDAAVWVLSISLSPLSLALSRFVQYGALSLLATVFLYVEAARGGRPGEVLKGQRLPWLQPLFLPFRAVSWCVWIAARTLRSGDGPTEVLPGLWVGPRPLRREIDDLAARGVAAVVDLAAELPTLRAMGVHPWARLGLPVLDRTVPADDDLARVAEWIAARRAGGVGVYVHCAFGRGRSGVVACAAAIASGDAHDAAEALAKVRAKRAWVRLRKDQYAAVARYAAAVRRR